MEDIIIENNKEINEMPQITLTNNTIRKILTEHHLTERQLENAIAEFIWNGFDAEATIVEFDFEFGGSDFAGEPTIRKLTIKDNGYGIDFNKLDSKFKPFYDSEKALIEIEERHHSSLHGKNGIGRLAFSAFARQSKWITVFKSNINEKRLEYTIEISDDTVGEYSTSELSETKADSGTLVEFSNFKRLKSHFSGRKPLISTILNYLKREFGWYLGLNKERNLRILINGSPLDYSENINDDLSFSIIYPNIPNNSIEFKIHYIQWNQPFTDEYSRFYYMGSDGIERYKETTGLNKKGDNFYHSVFIRSEYFDDFPFEPIGMVSSSKKRSDAEFKFFHKEIERFLKNKRKPFLREHSTKLIAEYEKEGYIDRKNKTAIELLEIDDLEAVLKEIYITEPGVFAELSRHQIQTIIGLFRLILSSDERERVLHIVESVVKLEPEEREHLSKILRITDLNKVIKTIDLIIERTRVIQILKEIIFKPEYGANERDHLQKIVGSNYWIFGEQYNLVAEATDDFEMALRNFLYLLRGVKKDVWIESPDKSDKVDIFLCRQDKKHETVHNIIVELKHPKTHLGEKEGYSISLATNSFL
jgi:hypothetical protein